MNTPLWRSLDELVDSPARQQRLEREFPPAAAEEPNEATRRQFLKLLGSSLALAGAAGCTRRPLEKIVPYVQQPEGEVPGEPSYFATALTLQGYARGVIVESHEGRPTKIEGNPRHPASLGRSDLFMQAELLELYDPDRAKEVKKRGGNSNWETFAEAMAAERQKNAAGKGWRLLTGHVTSPTLLDQIGQWMRQYPEAKWHVYEPLMPAVPPAFYDLSKAKVVVSLDSDFLGPGQAQVRYTRDFAEGRRAAVADPLGDRRLYVAESSPTITGATADNRFSLAPAALREFAAALATGRGVDKRVAAVLDDLRRNERQSLILAGETVSLEVREFARRWNEPLKLAEALGSAGQPLHELIREMAEGKVEALVILGGNPVYDAPTDFDFGQKLAHLPLVIRLGPREDETGALSHWFLPEAHPLETWSDARAFEGTATIMQPLIEPLYGGKSAHEVLALLSGSAVTNGYEIVRGFWKRRSTDDDFESLWFRALKDGVVNEPRPTKAVPGPTVPLSQDTVSPTGRAGTLDLLIRPDPNVFDGRYANNAWLQELPRPFSKITWENAALISPATAQRLDLAGGQMVELRFRGRSVQAPVWLLPGQADETVTVHTGYGRSLAGRCGNGAGFNAWALRTSDAPWGGPGLEIVKIEGEHPLASTQEHYGMEGREPVRRGTLADFRRDSGSAARGQERTPRPGESLYPPVNTSGHAWGMSIDLSACTGCNVCTLACQAENNIPVVGKEEVARGRVMHWIRVDTYFEGSPGNPKYHFQPVPCMHCENAPCEPVCPVAATVHSSEGLNQMVYNRCVGTRYCSNNCPYKVRRFNFLEYGQSPLENAPVRKLLRNPQVTVRTRGVMEKCTYCVQRINRARITAETGNRALLDGDIVPACAQACPAEAIVFGDLNDPKSRVARLKASALNYALLAELNTRPRTTYLAKLKNPNPEAESA